MSHIIGKGRYAKSTYPVRSPAIAAPATDPAFAFVQDNTVYNRTTAQGPLQIASASITVAAGSRVKIEAEACYGGSAAPGAAAIGVSQLPGVNAIQSFQIGDVRTNNLLGVTPAQPGGLVTVNLMLEVTGNSASVTAAGATVLTLTEIRA